MFPYVLIKDINEGIGNFTIIAKVVKKPQKGQNKALIEDESGRISLILHDNQVDQIKEGQMIRLSGVFAQSNGKFMEITCWMEI